MHSSLPASLKERTVISQYHSHFKAKSLWGNSSPGIVSIHDVMPHTLPDVLNILHMLKWWKVSPVTLLIVPGLEWTKRDIHTLQDLQEDGYELAGHGWRHQCKAITTFGHQLHSVMMSRNEAEHLSLQSEQIRTLLSRNFHWFQAMGFQEPTLYVPPAWAMGRISEENLHELPFNIYEYLTGIYDSRHHKFFRLPVVGYLADTPARVQTLQALNAINMMISTFFRLPLRVAIHPHDFQLGLASQLRALLSHHNHFISYFEAL